MKLEKFFKAILISDLSRKGIVLGKMCMLLWAEPKAGAI